MIAVRDYLKSTEEKEIEYVLSHSNPTIGRSTRSTADLAVEINSSQFTADPVSVASALWRSTARSPTGLLLLLTREPAGAACAREPGVRLPIGHGSTIPPGEDDPFPGDVTQLCLACLTATSPCVDEAAGQSPSWEGTAVDHLCRVSQPSHQVCS